MRNHANRTVPIVPSVLYGALAAQVWVGGEKESWRVSLVRFLERKGGCATRHVCEYVVL